MFAEKLAELGSENIGAASSDPLGDLNTLEQLLGVELPTSYRGLLMLLKGPVIFNNGAIYRPDQPSPWDDVEGLQTLEMLYGLGSSTHGLIGGIESYQEEIPAELIPIGEAPGGNQICLTIAGEERGFVYFWDHEFVEGSGLYRITSCFDDFMVRLQSDPSGDSIGDNGGVIDSESWLDL